MCLNIFGFKLIKNESRWRETTEKGENLNSQQTQSICITFIQLRLKVFDVGPTLYKCYTEVMCLLGWRTQG